MASPPCMSEDGNVAVFVGTMLQTGDAVALCDECLVPWSAALLHAMTGVDPTPFLEAVSDPLAGVEPDPVAVARAIAQDEAEAADPPPKPGRSGRMSNGSQGAGTENAPGDGTKPTRTTPESSTA